MDHWLQTVYCFDNNKRAQRRIDEKKKTENHFYGWANTKKIIWRMKSTCLGRKRNFLSIHRLINLTCKLPMQINDKQTPWRSDGKKYQNSNLNCVFSTKSNHISLYLFFLFPPRLKSAPFVRNQKKKAILGTRRTKKKKKMLISLALIFLAFKRNENILLLSNFRKVRCHEK